MIRFGFGPSKNQLSDRVYELKQENKHLKCEVIAARERMLQCTSEREKLRRENKVLRDDFRIVQDTCVRFQARVHELNEKLTQSARIQLDLQRCYREAIQERDDARKERNEQAKAYDELMQVESEYNKVLVARENIKLERDSLAKSNSKMSERIDDLANQVVFLNEQLNTRDEQTEEISQLKKLKELPEGMTQTDVQNLKDSNCNMADRIEDQKHVIYYLRRQIDGLQVNLNWHKNHVNELLSEAKEVNTAISDLRSDVAELNEIIKRQNIALENCKHYAEEGLQATSQNYRDLQFRNVRREVDDAIQKRKAKQ